MKISVLGCGRWASFIAWYLNKINHEILIWGRSSSEKFKSLKETRKNKFLTLNKEIKLSNDLDFAVNFSDILIISISSQSLRDLMLNIKKYKCTNKTFVLCMKGIEQSTLKRLTEIVNDVIPNSKCAIWVGPGHVEDLTNGIPNCMVIDSNCDNTKQFLISKFSSDLIRFYLGTDLIGNEVGAASKNVIGIAAGMLDGIGYSSLKGALMSRGSREIARLIKAMGGNEISAYGLAHLGDYEATLFSKHSHNRQFGEALVNGKSYNELAEGVKTALALVELSKKYKVDLPICKAVCKIVYNNADFKDVLSNLFIRSIKKEF